MKASVPSPLDVARAIAERRSPVPTPIDWVALGQALDAAKAAGFIDDDFGYDDDWGGYSVTPKGREAIQGASNARIP